LSPARGLEVEEVEVEDPSKVGRSRASLTSVLASAVLKLAMLEPDLRGGSQRVERLAGRDAQLCPSQIADEL